jgi:hypothetical protein
MKSFSTLRVAPAELDREQRSFLEEIRRHAPEVLEALRDEALPHMGTNQIVTRLKDIARRFYLWREESNPAGTWLLWDCWSTLVDWRDHPVRAESLQWAEPTEEAGRGFSDYFESARFQALTGVTIPAPPPYGTTFEYQTQMWDEFRETWSEFVTRVKAGVEQKLLDLRSLVDQAEKDFGFEKVPSKRDEHHYLWLVRYQIKGWSKNRLAKESGKAWSTVYDAIKSTSRYLIGQGWDKWLR